MRERLKAIGDNLVKSNHNPFREFTKSLRQISTGDSPLDTINATATSAIDEANALNNQFHSVFIKDARSSLHTFNSSLAKSMLPMLISTDGIAKLLKKLRPQKAPGPDCITATILKTCAEQDAPLLQQIFQKSLNTGELPFD